MEKNKKQDLSVQQEMQNYMRRIVMQLLELQQAVTKGDAIETAITSQQIVHCAHNINWLANNRMGRDDV